MSNNYFDFSDIKTDNDYRTQCEQIKDYLRNGGSLSKFDAIRLFRITTLAQRVHDLRHRHGLIIDSNVVEHKGKRFVVYTWNPANDIDTTNPAFDTTSKDITNGCTQSPVTGGSHE